MGEESLFDLSWSHNQDGHHPQGWHRLEKYVNLKGFLEKSLKIKICLEKYWKITQKP